MNPLFTNLTQETLAYLEDQLSNNDVAGDDELIDLFIEELSLTLEQAAKGRCTKPMDSASTLTPRAFGSHHAPLHQLDYTPRGFTAP